MPVADGGWRGKDGRFGTGNRYHSCSRLGRRKRTASLGVHLTMSEAEFAAARARAAGMTVSSWLRSLAVGEMERRNRA